MGKMRAALGSLAFFVVAPGTIAGLGPWLVTRWRVGPAFFGVEYFRLLGVALIAAGLVPLVASFARFVFEGFGTPNPAAPPVRLVTGGFYRWTRNPMYVGIVVIVLGQALYFGSVALVAYAALAWLAFHLRVVLYEEPTLRRMFGAEYQAYCTRVPRWVRFAFGIDRL